MGKTTLIIGNRNYSSWSLRAWLALEATGQDYDEVMIPLNQPETTTEILRWSPTGRVPALRTGDILLWDSLAICEHLAETHPERLAELIAIWKKWNGEMRDPLF